MTDGSGGPDTGERGGRDRLTRRSLLATVPAVLASEGGCIWNDEGSDRPGSTPTHSFPRGTPGEQDPIDEFDRVLDAVDDVGCDPTGAVPCDAPLESSITDGVAIRFPAGTYRFDRGHGFRGVSRLGLVGEGDVTFVPPEGFNDKLIEVTGDWGLFTGIDLDLRADETTAGVRFITNRGFLIEDVEFLGRGVHGDTAVTNALSLAVTDPAAQGTLRDVVATAGSAIGHYKGGNGRVGIWIGRRHNGHVEVRDCHLEEFGNNGIYASRSPGTTSVVGGRYRNNNVSGVRLGSAGSSVGGATIDVDVDQYAGPTTRTDEHYNTRAIVVEQGPQTTAGRVLITDCEIGMRSADRSQGALVVWPTGHGPRIRRSRIVTDVDRVAGVRALSPVSTLPSEARLIRIDDSVIAGAASTGSAVEILDRPGSAFDGTTVEQTGTDRDGITLVESNPISLDSTSVTVTRYAVVAIDPSVTSDRCLVDLGTGNRLDGTVPVGEVPSVFDLEEDAGRHCVGERIFGEVEGAPTIAIASIVDGTVSWLSSPDLDRAGA